MDYSEPYYIIGRNLGQGPAVEKSIYTREYAVLLKTLRQVRRGVRVTQVELARRLGQSQSFVSKCERGERRLDLAQLRTICLALGTMLTAFVRNYERRLAKRH